MTGQNDDLMKTVEGAIRSLDECGCADEAARLRELVHEGAWSSSSEMIGDIGLAIVTIRDYAADRLSDEAASTLHRCTLHVATLQHSVGTLGGLRGGAVSGLAVGRRARFSAGLTQATGCLLVDFLQDFVENLKRSAHLAHIALTMPVIVHRLAQA